MSINGLLNLGTALSGTAITTPPSGAGYLPQPVSFDSAAGGVTLNGVSCLFGPVTAPWGTLTCFNVTDTSGNVYVAGTLQVPFTPVNGSLVEVPQGQISLALGSQFAVAPASSTVVTPQKGPTTSGSFSLASGQYTQILVSGARNMVQLQNADALNRMQVILGPNQPVSGALGYMVILPLQTWPPASMSDFVPTDAIWVMPNINDQVLNFITG